MRVRWLVVGLLSWVMMAPAGCASSPVLVPATQSVQVADGSSVSVEAGVLHVPESRQRPTARQISIPWYRLASTSKHPAAPIFLLAGGPGASGLDELRHSKAVLRAVTFYRTIADVIVFDQRGAGHSKPAMSCPQTAHYPDDEPLQWDRWQDLMRKLLVACRDHWQQQGVDLAAYNTVESAADVDALRAALDYPTMTLVGGSYGSHLALQMMRLYPHHVDRAVLYGIEGPDQTWDDPDGVMAALQRIARTTEAQATQLTLQIPENGLLGAWSDVIARLHAHPQTVNVTRHGTTTRVVVDANLVRLMIRHKAGSHDHLKVWPRMILALERSDYAQAARAALAFRTLRVADPMHWSMDCASGVSAARRERYQRSAARPSLGDINREYVMLCSAWPARKLGEAYRANVVSSIPTLLFQGTWDVSTPLENARAVAGSLRNAQLITVVGGNHGTLYNLYDHWAPIYPLLRAFLSGHTVQAPPRVVMPWTAAPIALQR